MRGVRLNLEKRLKATFGNSITCEQTEIGMAGSGGFAVDHDQQATITAMQFRNDGLFVKICENTWYIVLRIKTSNMIKVDEFVRTQIPCKAPKTEWPPTDVEDRYRKFRRQLRSARFYCGTLLSAVLRAPVRMFSRHRRST
ncbi:hypothetical protein HYV69_01340 [Candidatus Uhrbacteria bacterium]|nr:hypothetical protein [Candidatus Uhrbacteria bacterium]